MERMVELKKIYSPSQDVVAREVQGELIIIPITSGIADIEDEIFTLNETGRAIWDKLDGKKSLQDVTEELLPQFETPAQGVVERDVLGLVGELLKRRMLVEIERG